MNVSTCVTERKVKEIIATQVFHVSEKLQCRCWKPTLAIFTKRRRWCKVHRQGHLCWREVLEGALCSAAAVLVLLICKLNK